LLPSAKCTRPIFQGRTGCGGRPSGWHDIVTCQHLVTLKLFKIEAYRLRDEKSFLEVLHGALAPKRRLQMRNMLHYGDIFRAVPFPTPPYLPFPSLSLPLPVHCYFIPFFSILKDMNKKLSYHRQNALSIVKSSR